MVKIFQTDDLFQIIDDLVLHRNDIAHGTQTDTILGLTEFENYIEFLERYCKAIFETIVEKEIQYEAKYLYKKIINIKEVYKQGSILCFEIENNTIRKGDFIIIETPDNHFFKKEIFEIQKNNARFVELNVTSKTDIGVNLGNGMTKKQIFYIKKNCNYSGQPQGCAA